MTQAHSPATDLRNAHASAQAMALAATHESESTSLIQYYSRGRVAVIGGHEAQDFAARLSGKLTAQVILTDGAVEPGVPAIPVGNRQLRIDGYLGNFNISLGQAGRANYEAVTVDLVLDLSASPLLTMAMKPPGYLTAVAEEPYLTQAEQALNELTGTFEKPKYFSYDASICAHGRSGIGGCTNCIDACPADAITALLESVEVNPNLCQGGGICASVCPSGAIRYVYPTATDTLKTLRTLLNGYRDAGGDYPVIAFAAADEANQLTSKPANLLVLVVEELASVGLEIWLSALAFGATRVLLLDAGAMPEQVGVFLQQQVMLAKQILQGLGYAGDAVRLVDYHELEQQCAEEPGFALAELAHFTGSPEKRRTVLQAIDHLYRHSATPAQVIALAEHSPFGRIVVDADACTLCMSCSSVCPSKAISAGNEIPRLEFHEINCVQCGICASACPEQAITLEPRLIADAERRRTMTTLHEDAPFCCIRCGKPFATQSLIDNMVNKLAGHYMFSTERARQRLLMCEDCRVFDVVQDADAMRSI